MLVLGGLALVTVSAYAGYWYANRQQATLKPDDETANWKTYESKNLGFSFKYPNDWYIYERNDYKRIYIQTTKGEVTKATAPADFKRVWISYDPSGTFEGSNEEETKNISGVTKSTIGANGVSINFYTYTTLFGDVAQAYWSGNQQRYFAKTATEVGIENQKDEVATLKYILSTLKFLD